MCGQVQDKINILEDLVRKACVILETRPVSHVAHTNLSGSSPSLSYLGLYILLQQKEHIHHFFSRRGKKTVKKKIVSFFAAKGYKSQRKCLAPTP